MRHGSLCGICSFLMLLVVTSGVAANQGACSLPAHDERAETLAQLPPKVRDDLMDHFAAQHGPTKALIADRAEPFNDTDVIFEPNLPPRRFLWAIRSKSRWIVAYEHGGFAPHIHLIVYNADNSTNIHFIANVTDSDPCNALKLLLQGANLPPALDW